MLKNVSFRVNPGETVALVGPTGSGKSSSMALVHRFYDVWSGQVLVGGHDVRDLTQDSLGDQVAMVLQEPFLFSGTVLENIRYHKTGATREEVVRAAQGRRCARLHRALARGYDTELEQRGGNLSLGQRQLISFARALVADAKILVLDEATASIDSYTEMLIQKALVTLLEGRTGLVIAHRLATIRGADRIIVLQNGEIIESGNHDQLMAKQGPLRPPLQHELRLVRRHFRGRDGDGRAGREGDVSGSRGGGPRRLPLQRLRKAVGL